MKGFKKSLSSLFIAMFKDLKSEVVDYSFITSAATQNGISYFLGEDGSCATVFVIDGAKNIQSDEEFNNSISIIVERLGFAFKKVGHSLQFAFLRDPERSVEAIKDVIEPYQRQSKKLGLKFDFLAKSKIDELKDKVVYEEFYMVAWTLPAALGSRQEAGAVLDDVVAAQRENYKKYYFTDTQDQFAELTPITNKHISFVQTLNDTFNQVQLSVNILNAKEAANKVRRIFNSSFTHPRWEPLLTGREITDQDEPETVIKGKKFKLKKINSDLNTLDTKFKNIYMRDNRTNYAIKKHDLKYFLYPSLKAQLIPADIEEIKSNIVCILDKYFGLLKYNEGFSGFQSFDTLLSNLNSEPFLFSMKLNGGAMSGIGLKKTFASILAFFGRNNKNIKQALDTVVELENAQEIFALTGASVITWSSDLNTLKGRVERVLTSMKSFGNAEASVERADPYKALFDTVPLMNQSIKSDKHINLLKYSLQRLPFDRQANIWNNGWIVNRTNDGKILPFEVASKIQASWNELIFAKPGSGKSVWSNNCNFSFLLNPENQTGQLPLISITDIGKSSSGLIRLIRSFLPENRKHEAIYYRLANDKSNAINVFDIHLGCRSPNIKEKEFIVSFLSMLLTPAGAKSIDSLDNVIGAIVDELYRVFATGTNRKDFQSGQNPNFAKRLKELELDTEGKKWWDIVDELVVLGHYDDAVIAQRYAMPVLQDFIQISNLTKSIADVYKNVVISTSENIIEFLNRSITEAIQSFPILADYTKLDFEKSRVISLDLNDVAPDGNEIAKKQSNVFYFLARYITTKNFFIDAKVINKVETDNTEAYKNYVEYHQKRADLSLITPKRLVIDELHRTSGLPAFKHQIMRDMREGRKWNLSICVISQLLDDFDKEFIELCNSKFIFSGGADAETIADKFKIQPLTTSIKNNLTGPTSSGVPLIGVFTTNKGEFSQFLYNTLSPMERWCFSSTAEDDVFREKTEKAFGLKGLLYLAETFPKGSINPYIKELVKRNVEAPAELLFTKLLNKYNRESV